MADKSRNRKYDIVMQAEKIVEDYEKKYFVHTAPKDKTPHKDAVTVTVMFGAILFFAACVIAGIILF